MFDQKNLGAETTGDTARRGRSRRDSFGPLPSHGECLGRAYNDNQTQNEETEKALSHESFNRFCLKNPALRQQGYVYVCVCVCVCLCVCMCVLSLFF